MVENFKLPFELRKTEATVRKLQDMVDVVFDKKWLASTDKDMPLYWMWRGLEEKDKLRYDVLQFNDGSLGKELMKTAGHGHSLVPDTDITYPELYQVLQGEVIYFLQEKISGEIKKIISINCQAGDFCLVPPNFEHITINLAGQKTIMANWISSENKSDYSGIKEKNGGAYYGLVGSPVSWVKNNNYQSPLKIEDKSPTDFNALGIDIKENMLYNRESPNVLNFLKEPQKYPNLWSLLY